MLAKKDLITEDFIQQCKNEMIRRYCYLYKNHYLIMAPLFSQIKEQDGHQQRIVCDNFLERTMLIIIENLLLNASPMEITVGYNYLEMVLHSKGYQQKLIKWCYLKEKYNFNHPSSKIEFSIIGLLSMLYRFVSAETADNLNSMNKLRVIDEYIRIARFHADGKDWESGMYLTFSDMERYIPNFAQSIGQESVYSVRKANDCGEKANDFVRCFNSTYPGKRSSIHLTTEEKKKIYFYLGDHAKNEEQHQKV